MTIRSAGFPSISEPRLEDASRRYLTSPEGQSVMERAAAEYVKTGIPSDDLPDWTVLFDNALT